MPSVTAEDTAHHPEAANSEPLASEPTAAKTSADYGPQPLMPGFTSARLALAALTRAKPRAIIFVQAPRTQRHDDSIQALLSQTLTARQPANVPVLVTSFADAASLTVLRVPWADAKRLATGVARAIEMLSVTVPSAYHSDSTRVARLTLEEELRSGHDTAIDALKRKALANNIGVLRTPLGYAVAPMHDGRVVAPDVFKALPSGLKADVEAKLEAFESELSGVLANRSQLQQGYHERLRELEHDVASLAVRASLSDLASEFADTPVAAAWLDALSSDLAQNAALFVTAARTAQSQSRAPVEIANDPALARYRVAIMSSEPQTTMPECRQTAELFGWVQVPSSGDVHPFAVRPGALTRAGDGVVIIKARELMAQLEVWSRLKQAFRRGSAAPINAASPGVTLTGIEIPFDARLVVTGDHDDYRAWCRSDPDVARVVTFITAYDAVVPLTAEIVNDFHGLVSAIVTTESLRPLDAPALAAVLADRTTTARGMACLTLDLDTLPQDLSHASELAASEARATISVPDVIQAIQARQARQATLESPP